MAARLLGLALSRIGSEEGAELIDEGTGQRLRIGRDAGSFFLIPSAGAGESAGEARRG